MIHPKPANRLAPVGPDNESDRRLVHSGEASSTIHFFHKSHAHQRKEPTEAMTHSDKTPIPQTTDTQAVRPTCHRTALALCPRKSATGASADLLEEDFDLPPTDTTR